MKEIIQVFLVYLFLFGKERVSSLPTESTLSPEDNPTTFHTAELLISPKQNARILEPSSTFFIVPTSTLENSLGDDNSSLKNAESSSQIPFSSVPDELSTTTVPSYVPEELTTFETLTTTLEERTNIDETSVPIRELSEGVATTTTVLKHEELQTDTTLPPSMVYAELATTESVTQTEEVYTTAVSSTTTTTTTTTTTSTTTSTTTTTTTTTASTTSTTERKWTTITPFLSSTLKETTPTPAKTEDPLLYSYQNDPHWDVSMDFSDYQEEIESKKDKSKLNKIQLMDEGVKDSMTIVLTPINYVHDAMVHIKYRRISNDPTEDMSPDKAPENSDMTTDVSFPLLNEENRRNLENLPEGWYFVCAEITKFDKMLEQECFHARIFEKASPRLETGIIVLIVLAMLIIVLLAMYIVYNKLQKSRRKKKDKEMQDRIDKMAQKERELNERNKPAFHHIYVDPDEPYEERCIM